MKILTISTDAPDELAKGHCKHKLGATMLSDLELEVTDRFGLRNKGIHSGPPPPIAAKALPGPTSLLVDANGRVLWMDQSENYQPRSDPDYFLAAACATPWIRTGSGTRRGVFRTLQLRPYYLD